MYKTNFPNYGDSMIMIWIRSREQLGQHFKVIGHWKKDASDKHQVIKTTKDQAQMICTLLNSGQNDLSAILRTLEKENSSLKEQIEIIADVNWRTGFGWKVVAFATGIITGFGVLAFINHYTL